MNEGKPTKAKWWSRPRTQDAPGEPEGAAPGSAETVPGETGVPGPSGATGAQEAAPGAAEAEPSGDFRLEPPGVAARPVDGDDGDYELARPLVPRGGDGDYELERPVAADGDAASKDSSAAPGTGQTPGATSATPVTVTTPVGAEAVAAAPAVDAERVKPLHDPDPYNTPPYGEPGPWAPAPPVQHPAVTPTHGTATPAPAPAAPVPGPPGTPAAAPTAGAPALATPPHGLQAPTPGTQAAAPTAAAPTAAPAAAVPTPPAPTPAASPSGPPPATPPAHASGAPAPATPAAPHPPGAPTPPPYADAPPPTPTALNPWQRYDPWAAQAAGGPLQQNGAAVATPEQRRRRARKALLVGAVLLAVVSGGVGGVAGAYLERNGGVGTVELPQAGKEPAGRAPGSVAGIAARALPSVVTLHVSGSDEQGTGTGFLLDTRGHILTNNHVVEPAGTGGEITVTFNSGDTAKGTLVGRDSGYDLAVVRVKGVRGLSPLPLGNSENVQVGDPVVAIGAPFDLAGTVTSGIISAKERPITAGGEKGDGSDVSYVDALQTDAPINPGNSGGPLLDSRGRVVGINSAIRSADTGSDPEGGQSGSIGLGFAIPINQGKRVAEELINTGRATHPVIGITLDMDYTGDGARVGTKGSDGGPPVTPGGPGARAGIRPGDVITEVDGRRVHSGEELIVKTRAHRPGDRLELTLRRDGAERKVSLRLGSSGGD
ncbi:S1C family serine protease [Streptomyces bullii]